MQKPAVERGRCPASSRRESLRVDDVEEASPPWHEGQFWRSRVGKRQRGTVRKQYEGKSKGGRTDEGDAQQTSRSSIDNVFLVPKHWSGRDSGVAHPASSATHAWRSTTQAPSSPYPHPPTRDLLALPQTSSRPARLPRRLLLRPPPDSSMPTPSPALPLAPQAP